MASARINRNIVFTLKLALGVALLSLIFSYTNVGEIVVQLQSAIVGYLLLAIVFQVIAKGIWARRWQTVLKLNGIQRRFWVLLGLVHIGLFFNNFLPSSVGGDAIRGYYASDSNDRLAKSYGAVLIERIVGVISLAFMSAIAVSYAAVRAEWQSADLLLVIAGAGSVLLLICGLSFLLWDGWQRLLGNIAKVMPSYAGILHDLSTSLKMLRRADRASSALIFISSIALQVVAVYFYLACARSLGITTPTVMFFVIIPISVVVAMLPISLNGLGVREAVLITMFVAQGEAVAPVSAFVLLALAISTAFGLIGGILFILWRVDQ